MGFLIELSPKAQREIEDAWLWYESELHGLGEEFKREVVNKANLIATNPSHYPLKANEIREANLNKT